MTFKERTKKVFSGIWEYIKIARIELIVFAAVLAADLITKGIVEAVMDPFQRVVIIPKFFNLYFTYNPNAAFGSAFGLDKLLTPLGVKIVLLIVTALAMAFFAVFLYKTKGKHITGRLGLAMLLAGALGNFIDRLFIIDGVRDFIQIEYFGLNLPLLGSSFAVFNIADVGVTAGVVLFLVYIIFFSDFGKEKKADEKSEYVLESEGAEIADSAEKIESGAVENTVSEIETEQSSSERIEQENEK